MKMNLTASEVKPGPHWVRVNSESNWFLLDIQQPGGLSYGLGNAEFVPVCRPGYQPDAQLAAGHPLSSLLADLCARNRRAEKAMEAAADDIHKVLEAFNAQARICTEGYRLSITVAPETEGPRDATAEKLRTLLPEWKTTEPGRHDCGFVYTSRRVLDGQIEIVVYSMKVEPLAPEAEAEPAHAAEPPIEQQE
ncbi:MAG: hypothetical protein HYZ18_13925 [Pseudogulbenkiania sp.]|nr:hypothetical protein [Pseudogulbenkiania sp.]